MSIITPEEKTMSAKQMDEIRRGLAERLNLKEVGDDASLKELGLDSLDVVEYCLELEDTYGISFAAEELSSFETFGELCAAIEKKLS